MPGVDPKVQESVLRNVLAGRAQPTEKTDVELVNHLLRILFLVTLFRLRAFLLQLSKHLCHVFDLVPDIAAYIDWRGLLSRHRDTVAGPCIYLNDFLLLRFVLRTEDKSRKIGAALEIIDDCSFDLCFERS